MVASWRPILRSTDLFPVFRVFLDPARALVHLMRGKLGPEMIRGAFVGRVAEAGLKVQTFERCAETRLRTPEQVAGPRGESRSGYVFTPGWALPGA